MICYYLNVHFQGQRVKILCWYTVYLGNMCWYACTHHTHTPHTHTHTHTHTLTHLHTYTHTYIHILTHAHTHTHSHIYTHICTHTDTCTHTLTHTVFPTSKCFSFFQKNVPKIVLQFNTRGFNCIESAKNTLLIAACVLSLVVTYRVGNTVYEPTSVYDEISATMHYNTQLTSVIFVLGRVR